MLVIMPAVRPVVVIGPVIVIGRIVIIARVIIVFVWAVGIVGIVTALVIARSYVYPKTLLSCRFGRQQSDQSHRCQGRQKIRLHNLSFGRRNIRLALKQSRGHGHGDFRHLSIELFWSKHEFSPGGRPVSNAIACTTLADSLKK